MYINHTINICQIYFRIKKRARIDRDSWVLGCRRSSTPDLIICGAQTSSLLLLMAFAPWRSNLFRFPTRIFPRFRDKSFQSLFIFFTYHLFSPNFYHHIYGGGWQPSFIIINTNYTKVKLIFSFSIAHHSPKVR